MELDLSSVWSGWMMFGAAVMVAATGVLAVFCFVGDLCAGSCPPNVDAVATVGEESEEAWETRLSRAA